MRSRSTSALLFGHMYRHPVSTIAGEVERRLEFGWAASADCRKEACETDYRSAKRL